jgi:flavin reductase (DIM6/NTAB) family NADH-FMN oxidoreductase RutF
MSIDAKTFRQIMGRFATGVTIVTTAVDGWLHGMTANAVASLSLEPMLVLVCVDKAAHAHEQLARAGRFAVNILAEEQQELSTLFAVSAEAERDQLRGADYRLGPHGTPLLEGCLAHLECEVTDRCEGGDHSIYIGAVLGGEITREAAPLLFFQGAYRTLDSRG